MSRYDEEGNPIDKDEIPNPFIYNPKDSFDDDDEDFWEDEDYDSCLDEDDDYTEWDEDEEYDEWE